MSAFLEFLRQPFEIGSLRFTPLSILLGLALVGGLALFTAALKRILRDRVLPRAGLGHGVSVAIATLISYGVMLLGVLIILPVMIPGFNLNTLSLVIGGIGFGIGFGLRNIADNFVSGVILLIERPIKVGDHIKIGETYGDVVEIKARATTVRTNDDVDIIVPNSEFISGKIFNISHGNPRVRYRYPVGVSDRSDVHLVSKVLVEAALACPDVMRTPAPEARLIEFGESSLNFEVWVWTETMLNRPTSLRSKINVLIWEHFKRAGIVIPNPQRDLYIKEMPGRADA